MKRFLALAALVLGLASCQTEPEGLDVNVGGEVDTVVTVSLPETTRATNSAEGAFENVDLSGDATIRYILKIYQKVGDEYVASKDRQVEYSDGKSVVFPVRLVPNRDYRFVVWADYVEGEADVDYHYNTADLTKIKLNGEWKPMDETRDAFTGVYCTVEEGKKYTSASSINITLTRPFAKLRVITTDMKELGDLGIEPHNAVVTYTTQFHESFNAFNGQYGAETVSKTHTGFEIKAYDDNEAKKSKVLFTDYFFADDSDVVKFVMNVNEANSQLIKSNEFTTDIPVKRNYLTTISGHILTDGNNIKVEVENDGKFEGEIEEKIVEVGNATDLQEAINKSDDNTTIVLGGDINLGDLFGASIHSTRAAAALPIVIADDQVVVLDLNGHNITTPWEDEAAQKHYYAFNNSGSLTIQDSKGNGEIKARGIFNYGTMTLKSGTINACDGNGGYGVRNYDGAMFVMDGGSIVTSYEDGDIPGVGYDASPVRVDEGATATINGGAINNISNFTVAIDNYGTTTINDGTFTTIHTTIANSASMIINGGSFTCNGLEGVTAHALWAAAGTTTINGGIFDGKDNYNGFNVDADEGAIVNINGGKFRHVHSGSLYGKGTINVMGGEFFDDPSARVVKGYVAEKNGEVFVVSKIALAENFADNSWDKIILACQNNIVPESWNVGDKKAMTINGKDYQIRIIGKNHDTYTAGGKAPLTFQIAEIYGTAAMNATQTNTTGWSGSQMRTVTMPEILAAMPVKDAIKDVNKETLNGTRDGLETTSDKLFLLSEIEVNGSVFFSNNFEEGSRYAFYTDLNSQIMNASYWLRGPGKTNDIGYTQINKSGYMANGSAETAGGVVFGFCF